MTDVHDRETRSYNMSKIKGKDTKPELLIRKFLFKAGLRYKLHDKSLPGKPDLVLPKYKTVIFINGCFWHRHEKCKLFVIPKTRTQWWLTKIQKNVDNDCKNEAILHSMGWNVITIWECQLKRDKLEETLTQCLDKIKSNIHRV